MTYDPILFGKNDTERIVSVEPGEDTTELFIQNEDGSIRSEFVSNRYWILATRNIAPGFVKLKGNLHYNWGRQFKERSEFLSAKGRFKKYDTYSIYDPKESFLVLKGYTYFKGLKPSDVSILAFDIETTGLNLDNTAKLLLIANTFRDSQGNVTRKMFAYDDYANEASMIDAWCDWVREVNPSIMCGHNIASFDLVYLDFIAKKYNTSLKLGRDGSDLKFNNYESKFRKDGSQFYYYKKSYVYGRELVDTMFRSIQYDIGRKYESYALKQIIKHEGLEDPNRVFYDAGDIRFKYHIPEEWVKIKQYAEFDGDDALKLFDLMIAPIFYFTQSVPKAFQTMIESASGSQLNSLLVRSYLQLAHSIPKADVIENFEGAISIGNPGIYKNCLKWDVASLYPSIMLQWSVCNKKKDPFGHFTHMLKFFTEQRLANKKLGKDTGDKYYKDLEQSQKIGINSAYGLLGANGLNFNYGDGAALVTTKGREILTQAIEWSTKDKYNYRLVNCDTDSITICKQDQSDFSQTEQDSLLNELNSLYPNLIHWEPDGYFPNIIVLKAKNYILYDGKKIKYKGSGVKSTGKEKALQQFIKDIVLLMIEGRDNYTEVYNAYAKEILSITDIQRWVTKKTVTQSVLNPSRTNEQKLQDAIKGTDLREGDKFYTFFLPDGSVELLERFNGVYDQKCLLRKLFQTAKLFETVISYEQYFPNYALKKHQKAIVEL